ncbi:hypothetical protein [Methanopyrus kandleri]|uniref:Uncharacterized protein n=1 Tax=Methanopyrus kandleri TaxID=2320 RepID=A0A832TGP7_9EURY|nr:hypothetical protein [Methanopyrus kandleri]HII70439.1 hypothetical protein [Methanopyrus kandleri]
MTRRVIASEKARERILRLWQEVYLAERLEVDRSSVKESLSSEFYERFVPSLSDRAYVHLERMLQDELRRRKPELSDPEEAQKVIERALEIADEVLEEEAERALSRAAKRLAAKLKEAAGKSLRG